MAMLQAVKPDGPQLRLELLDAPDPTVLPIPGSKSGSPLFSGSGVIDYACGRCGNVLCRRMKPGQLLGLVFSCGRCQALNRVPPP
jgi:predicted RNA-binding Zn-ribbon protein involved in translation (DUF1610 family)